MVLQLWDPARAGMAASCLPHSPHGTKRPEASRAVPMRGVPLLQRPLSRSHELADPALDSSFQNRLLCPRFALLSPLPGASICAIKP